MSSHRFRYGFHPEGMDPFAIWRRGGYAKGAVIRQARGQASRSDVISALPPMVSGRSRFRWRIVLLALSAAGLLGGVGVVVHEGLEHSSEAKEADSELIPWVVLEPDEVRTTVVVAHPGPSERAKRGEESSWVPPPLPTKNTDDSLRSSANSAKGPEKEETKDTREQAAEADSGSVVSQVVIDKRKSRAVEVFRATQAESVRGEMLRSAGERDARPEGIRLPLPRTSKEISGLRVGDPVAARGLLAVRRVR
ncbi:MAG TPA: hypothetical protein PKL73_13190 [Polyangiaceae bacterium]|nr:MAG: hypothetical protein BWY17_02876 [Deltaproteobacteria bacterium ADurb.Bin207]HNS97898.1 hypothetical protein [Polyangiaceae bacterium]HNZ23811.1 hypothetical protein [Polyangiaceae bacterium]HOD22396.1 hypothetical protein [Polyangiaceae bacterium]HOE50537.1 hypothetical protein [Polyangiaceae bacterium]